MISFVITTHNRAQKLHDCLRSVTKAVEECGCEAEVIVVADSCVDNTLATLTEWPQVTVVQVDYGSPAASRNCGIRKSKGDIVACIDDDNIVSGYWLKHILLCMEYYPKLGVIGTYQKPMRETWVSRLEQLGQDVAKCKVVPHNTFVESGVMGGGVFRRKALEEQPRLYDESLLIQEDVELCSRIIAAGWMGLILCWPFILHNHDYDFNYLMSRVWLRGLNRKPPHKHKWLVLLLNLPKLIWIMGRKIVWYRTNIKV